jgi:hypothetical protein
MLKERIGRESVSVRSFFNEFVTAIFLKIVVIKGNVYYNLPILLSILSKLFLKI